MQPTYSGPPKVDHSGQGVWTILSTFTGIRTVMFGQAGDIPVPGAYDGLGYDELAVYRPSTGNFYWSPMATPRLSSWAWAARRT